VTNLPYLSSPGNISKALGGIKAAAVPTKVNQDFVKTILKITGGSGDQMTAFLKKIGFAGLDGGPTELYIKFRNPNSSGAAVASAIRHAYAPLYRRNEFAHALDEKGLLGLVVEETGQPHDAQAVKLTVSSFKNLKSFADFNSVSSPQTEVAKRAADDGPERMASQDRLTNRSGVGLNLGYTINVNLPATTDQAVYNAIFRAIKQNLLSEDDG
jgi:hypothetical protein